MFNKSPIRFASLVLFGSLLGKASAAEEPSTSPIPIVFIDQLGSDGEDLDRNLRGDTRPLRILLDIGVAKDKIEVRHITIAQLDQKKLKDARLVVIAGIASPDSAVPLLREFVEQGGQLMVVTGGKFDPAKWNKAAWLDGKGILPAALKPKFYGRSLGGGDRDEVMKIFHIDFESARGHEYFKFPGTTRQHLRELFSVPPFFKAVEVDLTPDQLSKADGSKIIARFDTENKLPYLVERQFGKGKTLFVSSGLDSQSNTILMSSAFVLFDRIMRSMAGLPEHGAEDPAKPVRKAEPRAELATLGIMWVPNAKPTIRCRLEGVQNMAGLRLLSTVQRGEKTVEQQIFPIELPKVSEATSEVEIKLDFAKFSLAKGDQMILIVKTSKNDGGKANWQPISDPVTLKITDEAGVLKSLKKLIEESEGK